MTSPQAGASLDYLKTMLPDYQTSSRQKMEWRRYPPAVVASLESGLAKASQIASRAALPTAVSN
jgi:hypothetical protein